MGLKWKRFGKPHLRDEEDDVWQALWRGFIAEFFGVLIFVFVSAGSVVAINNVTVAGGGSLAMRVVAIAFGHGLPIAFVIYAIGEVSGGHINPAVTWALVLSGRISILRTVIYWTAQILGGITGAAILRAIVPGPKTFGLGCHRYAPFYSAPYAFGAEVVYTFIFVFIVFSTAISPFVGKLAPLSGGGRDYGPGKLTPLALGLTILALHLVGIPFTGPSINPARSFGPAVVHGECWEGGGHWVYWLGPFLGATIAASLATLLFLSNPTRIRDTLILNRGKAFRTLVLPEAYRTADSTVGLIPTSTSGSVATSLGTKSQEMEPVKVKESDLPRPSPRDRGNTGVAGSEKPAGGFTGMAAEAAVQVREIEAKRESQKGLNTQVEKEPKKEETKKEEPRDGGESSARRSSTSSKSSSSSSPAKAAPAAEQKKDESSASSKSSKKSSSSSSSSSSESEKKSSADSSSSKSESSREKRSGSASESSGK